MRKGIRKDNDGQEADYLWALGLTIITPRKL